MPADLPRVQKEDVDQEAELLKLQGKTPNRALIFKRMSRQEAVFDDVPVGASLLWDSEPHTDPAVIETLVHWAMEQSDTVADLVLNFLEDPTEEGMTQVLKGLRSQGVELFKPEPKKERSLTQVVVDLLRIRPQTIEELYATARSIQPSNRPEAALRQIVRRLKKEGRITVTREVVKLTTKGAALR